jgi:hypothetical protein
MSYGAISRSQVEVFVAELNAAKTLKVRSEIAPPSHAERAGGNNVEEVVITACAAIRGSTPTEARAKDADAIEGQLSVDFYRQLIQLPPEVLNDLDFWRYVACAHLSGFIIWRDGSSALPASRAGFGAGKSAAAFQDCVPYRMFRRGQIACLAKVPGMTPLQIAKIPGTDLWRSHVLRVRIGNAPTAAATFLLTADGYRKGGVSPTEISREAAKLVKRLRSNLLMDYLDSDECRDVIEPEFRAAEDHVKREQAQGQSVKPVNAAKVLKDKTKLKRRRKSSK